MLKTIEAAMPGVRTLLITDSRGIARASSREELIGRDLSQREYFQTALHHPDQSTLYLSPPYTTVLNSYAMNLSCMVPDAGNGFDGIVVATLDRDYFKTLLASVQYAPDMWAAVAHGDGIQFLMVPDREGQAGKNLAQPGSFFSRHRESGRNETIMSGTVYATGEERLMAIRSIQPAGAGMDKPLVVAIGRDLRAVFAEWRTEAMTHGVVYILIVLATIISLRYHQARVRRADEETSASQRALRESEERYRLLAENTTDVFWQLDLRTNRFTYVSPSVYQLRGYTPEEVMAQPVSASLTPESRQNVEQWIANALAGFTEGKSNKKMELQRVEQPRKDGTTVWTEVSTTYIFDENKPVAVNGISRDITERKRMEEKLRESEKRLNLVIQGTGIGLWDWNVQTGETVFNDRWAGIVGYTLDELAPTSIKTWIALCHPDDLRLSDELLQRHFRGETGLYDFECRMKHKNGSWVWVHDRGRVAEWTADGKPLRMAGTHADITERKRAEQELIETSSLLRTFMNAIDESAFLMDRNGVILAANETVAKRLGKKPRLLVGSTMEELLPPPVGLRRRQHVTEVIATGKPARFEDERMGRIIDNALYPVFDTGGSVVALAVVGYDVTERKHAEEERERLIAELQKAIAEIKTLHGILPICSSCKKIRDDKGAWHQLETYIHDHTDAQFSHGLCADCARKMYPDYFKDK